MPFALDHLNKLTHRQINTAIKQLLALYDGYTSPPFLKGSPYSRLLELINLEGKSKAECQFGLRLLAKLLGGKNEELDRLHDNSRIVVATRIFLKFKVYDNQYKSDYGNNNSSLHDAVLACVWRTEELTSLLIQHGANPYKINDMGCNAAALYMNKNLPEASKAYFWEATTTMWSFKIQLLNFIVWTFRFYPEATLTALKGLELYLPSHMHQNLLNLHVWPGSDLTLLHKAAASSCVEVVLWLLEHEANPCLLMDGVYKPIDLAIKRLKSLKTNADENVCLEIITHLFMRELVQSLPRGKVLSPELVVNALLDLDIIQYRTAITNKIFRMACFGPFGFSELDLFTTLNRRVKELAREHIHFSYKIGHGSFGNVFCGIDNFTIWPRNLVAIKLMIDDTDSFDLRQEAAILSRLQHPNIVRFRCTYEKVRFGIVMQYAECSLENYLEKNTNLSKKALDRLIIQLHNGLRYTHHQGYLHLDLKPANILIENARDSQQTTLLIADFGAAAPIGQTRPYEVTSFAYCSPEGFILHYPYAITHDIFGFGVCLGYMDTKNCPWSEQILEDFEIRALIISGYRTTFGNKPMTPSIAKLVNWCWNENPNNRPTHEQIEEYIEANFSII